MDKNVEYAIGKVKEYYIDFFKRVDGTEDVQFRITEDTQENRGYLWMKANFTKKWGVRDFNREIYKLNFKELVTLPAHKQPFSVERPYYDNNIIAGHFAGKNVGLELDRNTNKNTLDMQVFYWALDPQAEREKLERKDAFDYKVWDGEGIVTNIEDIVEVDRSDFAAIDADLYAEYQAWVQAGAALKDKIEKATEEFKAKGY